ncbi:hypothetical protein U1Q18_042827, partial [Sarracenia purpurea var. burkii]
VTGHPGRSSCCHPGTLARREYRDGEENAIDEIFCTNIGGFEAIIPSVHRINPKEEQCTEDDVHSPYGHTHWYDSSLKSISNSPEMIYTYTNVVHGFSTRLTAEEARLLENQPGILSLLPEAKYELHTTRAPDLFGLDQSTDLVPESDSVG